MSRWACFFPPASTPAQFSASCGTRATKRRGPSRSPSRSSSGTTEDEAPLAARVAERYGAQHIVRKVSEREFTDDLPAILEAMDQPSIDGVNTWFVAKAAREAGLKVALSGLGGDELLAGYPSFVDLPRWRRRFGPLAAIPGLGRLARLALKPLAPRLARTRPKVLGLLEYAAELGRCLSAAPRPVPSARARSGHGS